LRALVLLAGPLTPSPRLFAEARRAELVVAADGGIRHAEALGRVPDLWVGDFDSTPPELAARFHAVPREVFPEDKDATDAELAARAALARGASELLFAGAVGGEEDHALGTYALALALAERKTPSALTDGRTWVYPLVPPGLRLDLAPGTPFSLVPMSDLAGVSIRGARWELSGAELPFGTTRALRNRVTRPPLEVALERGRALLIARPVS